MGYGPDAILTLFKVIGTKVAQAVRAYLRWKKAPNENDLNMLKSLIETIIKVLESILEKLPKKLF